ncbi:MAG: WbuC family cupin fold metalloprotein [Candidatus Sericytochromatia bacterium]
MRLIDDTLIADLAGQAEASPRRRAIVRFHEHEEPVQRMLNALRDDSYVQPHRHQDPDKVELFVALTGRLLVLEFDDEGHVTAHAVIDGQGPVRGAEIRPRTWHALLALDPVAVALEIIEGPFDAATHKKFAPWAPEDPVEGLTWIRSLRDAVIQ